MAIVLPDLNEIEIIGSRFLLDCADGIIVLYLCTTRRIQLGRYNLEKNARKLIKSSYYIGRDCVQTVQYKLVAHLRQY